jgi:hypothetical protein
LRLVFIQKALDMDISKIKKLPIGMASFSQIRTEGYVYVDKTRYLVDLIDRGNIYFLSRPRRFGKSLTCSVFEALFTGQKELFKGLDAEEYMNRSDYHTSPVIRLDMSSVTTDMGLDIMEKSLKHRLKTLAQQHGVSINAISAADMFDDLIQKVSAAKGKVVILLDEYDKPYTDFYTDRVQAEAIRKELRRFYVRIKANNEDIRFVFITGISKFARFGVFSTLSTLNDISLDQRYGEICGLTEAEIRKYFSEHLKETAAEKHISEDELIKRMRDYYDGFCFDGVHKLYNPQSTLNFFSEREFDDYWIETGASQLIAQYLKTRNLTIEQFRNLPVERKFVRTPGDMDKTSPEGFLYQGGYLSIKEVKDESYILDYPNTEVLNTMSRLLAMNVLTGDISYGNLSGLVSVALADNDKDGFIDALNILLCNIPYDDFAGAARLSIIYNRLKIKVQEWLYRSNILCFLRGCGVVVNAEMHTNMGRPDLVIRHQGNTYVIELKVAYTPEDVPAKLEEAITQMRTKNYLAACPPNAHGLALVIDDTKRQIVDNKPL